MISPYRVRVKTVAREVVRFHLDLVGVQVVRCGLHVTLCYFYKKLSCSYVTRSRERWRMKLRLIAADNINIFCLTVETVNSCSSHFTLSLLTTPTVKITVKDKYNKKNGLYFRMERQTTVRLHEIISFHDKITYIRQSYWGKGRYWNSCNYTR